MNSRSAQRATKPRPSRPDLSLLRHNLSLTVSERVRAHARALKMANALREAVQKVRHDGA